MANKEHMTKAKTLLAEATQRQPEEIPDDASVSSFDGWDSLSHMRLIMAMEEKMGRELPPEVVVDIASLADVAKYLS